MSEEKNNKNTEIAEFNLISNSNKKENLLLRRKKKRINRLTLNNSNNEFDLGRIKHKLSKILEEENKYLRKKT